jgi:hypothetical protein
MRRRELLHCTQESQRITGLVSPVDGLWIDLEKRLFQAENERPEIVN